MTKENLEKLFNDILVFLADRMKDYTTMDELADNLWKDEAQTERYTKLEVLTGLNVLLADQLVTREYANVTERNGRTGEVKKQYKKPLMYLAHKGVNIVSMGGYYAYAANKEKERLHQEEKLKLELEAIRQTTRTNKYTIWVGVLSTAFILVTIIISLTSKTDEKLDDINTTLKQTKTSLDSLRMAMPIAPLSPPAVDTVKPAASAYR